MKVPDCYFIQALDHEMILVDYNSTYKWITYEEFRKIGGNVIFVNRERLIELLGVFPKIDDYYLNGVNVINFQLELCIGL